MFNWASKFWAWITKPFRKAPDMVELLDKAVSNKAAMENAFIRQLESIDISEEVQLSKKRQAAQLQISMLCEKYNREHPDRKDEDALALLDQTINEVILSAQPKAKSIFVREPMDSSPGGFQGTWRAADNHNLGNRSKVNISPEGGATIENPYKGPVKLNIAPNGKVTVEHE